MYRTTKYTLIDGVVVAAEGPVEFPQTLNPHMDFAQAVAMLKAGAEVRRASIWPENTECGALKSSQGAGSSSPTDQEYWLNTGDGYIPYSVTTADQLARDWVVTFPPPPTEFSVLANYADAKEIPSSGPDLPSIAEEYFTKNPDPVF